jgi:hypothetical protein
VTTYDRDALKAEDWPFCDLCDEPQDDSDGVLNDWNGETGNHLSCEKQEGIGPETPGYMGVDTGFHPLYEDEEREAAHDGWDNTPEILAARFPEKFWIKWLHLFGGRLAISLVRNDLRAYGLGGRTISFERMPDGNGWFTTLHVGVYWLNVDWV